MAHAQPTTEPGRRAPAPGGLALVQAFLNTNDIEGGRDAFATPGQLGRWLSERGLIERDERVAPAEHAFAINVREALRDVIEARETGAPAERAVKVLERAAREADLRPVVGIEGSVVVPKRGGARGAIGHVLAAVPASDSADAWRRLKVCRNDACRWVYYDASRNRSGHWCTMKVCGNRIKARAYRARTR